MQAQQTGTLKMEICEKLNACLKLGNTAFENGHFDEAEIMLRAACKEVPKELSGVNSPTAIILENLAEVFVKQQRYGKAERIYRRVLGMHQRSRSGGAKNAARIAFKLAKLCVISGRLGMFRDWYQKGMDISRVTPDSDRREQASHMLKLVNYLHLTNQHTLAWTIYKEAQALHLDFRPRQGAEALQICSLKPANFKMDSTSEQNQVTPILASPAETESVEVPKKLKATGAAPSSKAPARRTRLRRGGSS